MLSYLILYMSSRGNIMQVIIILTERSIRVLNAGAPWQWHES